MWLLKLNMSDTVTQSHVRSASHYCRVVQPIRGLVRYFDKNCTDETWVSSPRRRRGKNVKRQVDVSTPVHSALNHISPSTRSRRSFSRSIVSITDPIIASINSVSHHPCTRFAGFRWSEPLSRVSP